LLIFFVNYNYIKKLDGSASQAGKTEAKYDIKYKVKSFA